MITSGAQGAIALAARVFVSPGAAVLVESPTYPNALDSFRAASARLVPVPVAAGWDDELVESSFRQALPRLAYFTPDFHNPTGRLMRADDRAALVRAARRTETLLIADESYLGLGLADDLPAVAPLAAHDPERVISIGGLSKSTWGGLRIGWVRATPSLVKRFGAARPSMDIANPLLEQLVALQLLDDLDGILAERRRRLARQLQALADALAEELPGWTFAPPDGGLCVWVALDRSSTSLVGPAARAGVRIVPGPQIRPRRDARAVPAPAVRAPAGDAARSGDPAGPGRRGRAAVRGARGRDQLRRLTGDDRRHAFALPGPSGPRFERSREILTGV